MIELGVIDEYASKALSAAAMNDDVQVFVETGKIVNDIRPILEDIMNTVDEITDLPRSPEEIKKDIKHEKNPMGLKQLNKKLNESYKFYKRR
jgi:hypothetical protein